MSTTPTLASNRCLASQGDYTSTAAETVEQVSPSEKSEDKRELSAGSVLLSTRDGRMLKLNSIATMVWELLESRTVGLIEIEISDAVFRLLEQHLPKPPSFEMVREDVQHLLEMLLERQLLLVEADVNRRYFYRPLDGIWWSGARTTVASDTSTPESVVADIRPKKSMILRALGSLLVYDVLLRVRGFKGICTLIDSPITTSPYIQQLGICPAVCEAVDRAQRYYISQILCLQRSVVITMLLRRAGVPAQTVIAAHLMPFKSHAWVEVDGRVVGDSANVQRYYSSVIRRLG